MVTGCAEETSTHGRYKSRSSSENQMSGCVVPPTTLTYSGSSAGNSSRCLLASKPRHRSLRLTGGEDEPLAGQRGRVIVGVQVAWEHLKEWARCSGQVSTDELSGSLV